MLFSWEPPYHNHFKALFPGPPGWAGARIEILDFMVQGKINRDRHTDHPAGRHSIRTKQHHPHVFYRPDALPATLPTVSKHWRLPENTVRKISSEQTIKILKKLAGHKHNICIVAFTALIRLAVRKAFQLVKKYYFSNLQKMPHIEGPPAEPAKPWKWPINQFHSISVRLTI